MSRWDVGLPPAIRSNYGSDHSIVGRAEETILYLTATHPLCLICGPGGMTGPTITLLDAASSQTLATVLSDGDLLLFTPVRRKPAKRGERWFGESDRILSPQRKDQAGQITKDTDISLGALSEMRLSRNLQGTGQMRFRKPPAVDTETNPATCSVGSCGHDVCKYQDACKAGHERTQITGRAPGKAGHRKRGHRLRRHSRVPDSVSGKRGARL